ncbi:MAG TPA: hypothetical protein VH593_03330 [Ktedonobacteraceae bacterium]
MDHPEFFIGSRLIVRRPIDRAKGNKHSLCVGRRDALGRLEHVLHDESAPIKQWAASQSLQAFARCQRLPYMMYNTELITRDLLDILRGEDGAQAA